MDIIYSKTIFIQVTKYCPWAMLEFTVRLESRILLEIMKEDREYD